MGANWQSVTNPSTGRPFDNEQDFNTWNQGMIAQASAAGRDAAIAGTAADTAAFNNQHNTTYNFGQGGVWSKGAGGYEFFGSAANGDSKTWVKILPDGSIRPATDAEKHDGGWSWDGNGYMNQSDSAKVGIYEVPSNGGYIDPRTGQIHYIQNGSFYDPGAQTQTKSYYYDQDYGLGPTAKGIIPIQRDANGTPTKFYAGTAGGGGQVFSSLADAQASVQAYKSWYDSQHPAGTQGTQIAPTPPPPPAAPGASTASPTPSGILTHPGVGETYFDQTKGFYGQPTNAQEYYDSTKDFYTQPTNAQQVFNQTPGQPTESQQLWNKYSGIYANPNYLDDYFNTEEKKAQTTLDRKAASGGWGDSAASARATGGIGLDFANRKLLAMQGFTQTGMGLAGSADQSGLAQTTLRGNLANAADSSTINRLTSGQTAAGLADTQNLGRVTAGQTAANGAEGLLINRETGGLNSAINLGNDQAALTSAGFNAANAQQYQTQLATLQLQVQKGQLTAQQAYQQAQDMAQAMGVISSTALNSYLMTKLGSNNGSTGSSTGTSDGTKFYT